MGDVVSLNRPDPADTAYEAEIREICWLARVPDRADTYIRRRTPIAAVLSDCILVVFGRRLPKDEARRFAEFCGPASTARRALPIHPESHGTCRRPAKNTAGSAD